MRLLLIFIFFSGISGISSEHVTVTYQFWEKGRALKMSEIFRILFSDPKISEKVEFHTRFLANSNQYWTSDLKYEQINDKVDKILISR